MVRCDECGCLVVNKLSFVTTGRKICDVCKFKSTEETKNKYEGVMNSLTTAQPVVNVYLKQGNKIIFADADDYFIDNNNGWLTIYKDGKRRATLSLSKVDSVFVE